VDQMVQAARSGKQNIIEASMASGTSKEMEIKLTNVARASLEELLAGYRDFLRVRGVAEWPKDHPFARRLAQLVRTPGASYDTFKKAVENPDPAIAANAIIGLIKTATYLLDRQLRQLEQAFLKRGRTPRTHDASAHRPPRSTRGNTRCGTRGLSTEMTAGLSDQARGNIVMDSWIDSYVGEWEDAAGNCLSIRKITDETARVTFLAAPGNAPIARPW